MPAVVVETIVHVEARIGGRALVMKIESVCFPDSCLQIFGGNLPVFSGKGGAIFIVLRMVIVVAALAYPC